MNMVEERMVTLRFNNENSKNTSMYHRFNNLVASLISPCHKRSKGPSWNNMVSHHILLSKRDRTSIGDVVGLIRKKKILILLRSLSPTLTLINLVFTSRFMVMMRTIVSQITPGVEIGPILNIKC